MKKYDVYKHPADGMAAVKQGFSGPAFLFTTYWALAMRLWSKAAGVAFATAGLKFLNMFLAQEAPAAADLVPGALALGIMMYVGSHGNEWRSERLTTGGYKFVATVDAESRRAAIAKVNGANGASPDSLGLTPEPVAAVHG